MGRQLDRVKPVEGPLRRYQPRWLEGRSDLNAGRLIRQAKLGTKIRVEWIYDERLRLVNLSPVD